MNSVNYHIDISDVTAHLLEVTLTFTPNSRIHELLLAAWIPGSYMIRDFARNIVSISAEDADGVLPLSQLDKQRWQVQCSNKMVKVIYQVYAYDLSVRAAYIDDEVAVLNPACLCLQVSEKQLLPHQITLTKPADKRCKDWRVATGLKRIKHTAEFAFGHYQADNYQELIDSPLLAGRFEYRDFVLNGITHYLVVSGENLTDLDRFTKDLSRICQTQVNVFGTLPQDLTSYWFLLWVTEDGYGGLEHLNSTLLLCSRNDLPVKAVDSIDDNYQQLLALCSHEYFHTWWVKRLKPSVFQQYQLEKEQYTSQLWLYEGFTSYFDDLALVRAGLIDKTSYIKTLEKTISRVTRNPSDTTQSLVDSSFNAWTKFYKQDENAPNAVVSYYAKGALLALCLDAELIKAGSSLTHIVRLLWQQCLHTGTADDSVSKLLVQLGYNDLATALQQWLHRAEALPLATLLPNLGLNLVFRPMRHADDLGGDNDSGESCFIGMQTKQVNGLMQISHVYYGGAAHKAGLMVGDQLLAADGRKVTAANWQSVIKRFSAEQRITLHFYRKDRLLEANVSLQPAVQQVAVLSIADEKIADTWLAAI